MVERCKDELFVHLYIVHLYMHLGVEATFLEETTATGWKFTAQLAPVIDGHVFCVTTFPSPIGAMIPRRAATDDRSAISSRTLASDCRVSHLVSLETVPDILCFIYQKIFFESPWTFDFFSNINTRNLILLLCRNKSLNVFGYIRLREISKLIAKLLLKIV